MITTFIALPQQSEKIVRDIHPPQTIDDLNKLRAHFQLESEQVFIVSHPRFADKLSLLERPDQVHDGCTLEVTTPQKNVLVSSSDGSLSRFPVAWYPRTSGDEIESTIARVIGLPIPLEVYTEQGARLVLASTIPNGTHLIVRPTERVSRLKEREGPSPKAANTTPLRSSHGPPQPASASSLRGSIGDSAFKLHSGIPTHEGEGTRTQERVGMPRPKSRSGTPMAPPPVATHSSSRVPESSISARDVLEKKSRRSIREKHGDEMQSSAVPRASAHTAAASPAHLTPPHPTPPGMRRTASSPLVRDASPNASSRTPEHRRRGSSGSLRDAVIPARLSSTDEHCIHMLQGHSGFVLCLCIVGDVLFTGSQDQNIMIWDLNNLQYIGTLPGHHGFVRCFAASYSRKLLFSGSQDKTIKVWSLDTFTVIKTLFAHRSDVHCLCILEHRKVLVSGSEDKSIRVWDLNTFAPLAVIDEAHAGGVFVLDCLPSNYVLSGGRDRLIKLWNDQWHVAKPLTPPHYDGVTALVVSAKRQKFYSASRDKSIKEWNGQTLENSMHQLHTHGDWVTCMALTPDENDLITGSRDCIVKVWDPATLQCKLQLSGHRGAVTAVQAVRGLLFSGSHDRIIRVWKLPT
eukprot:GEMP01013058.1.p1 GENE.GEMP01013058.1~~GEMP01013058.1.p1  ORF type:complete len:630 (+),score=130.89 GEMP01013058.1:97-1986(+)